MIKHYTFNGQTYLTEVALRQHLTTVDEQGEVYSLAVPAVDGDPAAFWAQYGVTYTEEEDPISVRLKAMEDGIQAYMDRTAHDRGYDSIYTAIGYLNSGVQRFREDAEAALAWRDQIWVLCHRLLDQWQAGEIEALTLEQVIERLPEIHWSETAEYEQGE